MQNHSSDRDAASPFSGGARDSKGISELVQIQLILPNKISDPIVNFLKYSWYLKYLQYLKYI